MTSFRQLVNLTLSNALLFVLAVIASFLLLTEDVQHARPTCVDRPSLCQLDTTPHADLVGRYTTPLQDVDLESSVYHPYTSFDGGSLDPVLAKAWQARTLKRWHYMSLSTSNYFVGFAIVKFSYIADVFLYVVDKQPQDGHGPLHPGRFFHTQRPLGVGVQFAPSSVKGCSRLTNVLSGDPVLSVCHQGTSWEVNVDLVAQRNDAKGSDSRVQMSFQVDRAGSDALALVYPIGDNAQRPAYIHKEAGLPSRGWVQFDDEARHEFQDASGSVDWTKSFALHETNWKWASLSVGKVQVTRVTNKGGDKSVTEESLGVNFSDLVYDVREEPASDKPFSAENAVWVGGRVYTVNTPIHFEIPDQPDISKWTVSGDGAGVTVNLTFTPVGLRDDNTNVADLILSEFIQPYGFYNGQIVIDDGATVVTVDITDAFGVVENHHAKW